jgi:aminoglycoside phosphotransferase (APT) family kinase protein
MESAVEAGGPSAVEAISERLSEWLGAPLGLFRPLASGWETTIFEFELAAHTQRAADIPTGARLVLRCYEGLAAHAKAAHESRVMFNLARAGYPTPRPFAFEPNRAALGAPFMIMERAAGGPLFATKSFPQAFQTFSLGFAAFVHAQTKLHRLPAATIPAGGAAAPNPNNGNGAGSQSAATLLDRALAAIGERIERGPLPGLEDAFLKLRQEAPRFRSAPEVPVHLDYHPQNVIVSGFRVTGVIDWVKADRGDRHLDAATTAAILATSAMDRPRWMRDNPAGNTLRRLFAALYIPAYQALAPMDLKHFRYCQAVAGLFRLSTFGMMRAQGPEAVGYRPEAIGHVIPDVVRLLGRYTARKCGVAVAIPPPRA